MALASHHRGLVVLVGALLGACGNSTSESSPDAGTPPTEDPSIRAIAWKSGSRLRARIIDGGGGAALFVAWVDTRLGKDCAFKMASDGGFRCLPVDASTPAPSDDPVCRTTAAVPDDVTQYVAATEIVDARTTPLAARVLVGEDGSRENSGLFDQLHQTSCVPAKALVADTQATTCLPLNVAPIAPGSTSQPCVLDLPSCRACPAAAFHVGSLRRVGALACDVEFVPFRLTGAVVASCSGGRTCPGLAVADNSFPRADVTRVGTGPLRSLQFTDAAGRPVRNLMPVPDSYLQAVAAFPRAQNAFEDGALGVPCLPETSGSFAGRCVPAPSVVAVPGSMCHLIRFSDDACTKPVYVTGGCSPVDSCNGRTWLADPGIDAHEARVYELGDVVDIRKVYRGRPGACAEDTSIDWERTVNVVRMLGRAIPATELPTVVERVE